MRFALFIALALARPTAAAERPNVLWLVGEDANVTWFGCYGNPNARTPNIDKLATQGYRYEHAYANAPVCAPSRSTWITGVYAVSTGTQNMRSRYSIPHDTMPYYPDQLRAGGYYCANHTKTDYNIGGRGDFDCWDSKTATAWKNCKPGQPFFQVVNFNESHESKAQGDVLNTRHSPGQVTLAKYHPDDITIRRNYAKYHDAVHTMDAEVGKALAALDESGLADDTIVVFCTDHGGVLPRSKRFLYDSGLHTPLIVRVPEKYKQYRPAPTPGVVDRLVSFIDMPKTWLSICGAKIPPTMQGHIFLGPDAEPEPQYVYSFRGRMDERIDMQRSVRDKRFVYIRNYYPMVPNGQHLEYLWKMAATAKWEELHKSGKTDAVTGRFFGSKPAEELYDSQADPDNVVNLAARPEHKTRLEAMRKALRQWQLQVRDAGLVPEFEWAARTKVSGKTIAELVRSPGYKLEAYLDAADAAASGDPAKILFELQSADPVRAYWGAVGVLATPQEFYGAKAALAPLLKAESGEVRAVAAWAYSRLGDADRAEAEAVLSAMLVGQSPAALTALNVIDWGHFDATKFRDGLDVMAKSKGPMAEYEKRMVEYLRAKSP